MLTIDRLASLIRGAWALPALVRVGLVLMFAGGAGDVVVHLAVSSHGAHHGIGPAEHAVHLLGLVGMVLVLTGVMAFGASRRRDQSNGGNRNATR